MKKILLTSLLMTIHSVAAFAETYTYTCNGIRPGQNYQTVLEIKRTKGFYPFTASYRGQWKDETTGTLVYGKEIKDLEGGIDSVDGLGRAFSLTQKLSPSNPVSRFVIYAQFGTNNQSGLELVVYSAKAPIVQKGNCVLTIK